jgi:DNA-binding transcriptional MerR regulator
VSTYSIKDLEQLSGIKAHTLRIWEQRYNLLHPKRTETNIRYYDDDAVKHLLNVALLNENGQKISRIAAMAPEDIKKEVLKLTENSVALDDQIHAMTFSLIDMDEEGFEKNLTSSIRKLGFERTMIQVIHPFMKKIGVLWQTGAITPGQEHFISNLVRQKLIVAIDALGWVDDGKKFMLFLPEGELHEISLLFSHYLIKANGHRVIYLGQSTPATDLQAVHKLHDPDYMLTVLTSYPTADEAQEYIDRLSAQFPTTQILISGYQVIDRNLSFPTNVTLMNNFEDFTKILTSIREASNGLSN